MLAGFVSSDEMLWRRVHPDHMRHDGRISSAAFSGREMSVDLAGIQMDMAVTLRQGAGVAELLAATAGGLGQDVLHDPLPDNRAHALVIGDKPKRVRRALRDASRFITRDEVLAG